MGHNVEVNARAAAVPANGRPAGGWTYYRDLLHVLVSKEFRLRYRSTFFGYAWSVLHPLALATVFFIAFKVVMRLEMEDYGLFLIAGLFAWQWFQNSVGAANLFFLGNSTLIKKVRFPRAFLVLAGVLNDLIHFVASIPVILLFMLYYGKHPTLAWLWAVPALVATQLMLTYGLALIVATGNLFFRDLERLTLILTMLWFYLTPVLYPETLVPAGWRWMLYANPMAPVVISWRALFLTGAPSPALMGVGLAWALALWGIGQMVYRTFEWRFAEVV